MFHTDRLNKHLTDNQVVAKTMLYSTPNDIAVKLFKKKVHAGYMRQHDDKNV
jgi:hypothetical protein